MPSSSYNLLIAKLLNVNMHGGIKLGLNNIERLNTLLGNPAQKFTTIHIAGTNGKGSVSTKIASALQSQGKNVGLYTSPHIACFRERIKINGLMIPESSLIHHLSHIFDVIQTHNIPATFFEITTILAFAYFAERNVEAAVIETGLGGRYDATNIVTPVLSVITSISLEHTEYLGDTIEKIAFEKAGIIKPNTTVVLGPRVPRAIFQNIADTLRCRCVQVEGTYTTFCEENEATALLALKELGVSKDAIQAGIKALPPCRLESIGSRVILDVAHNPDGIAHLLEAIQRDNRKLRFVFGISKSKDVNECLKLISKAATHIHLVEATNGRAASNEFLHDTLIKLGVDPKMVSCENTIQEGVSNALLEAEKNDELLVVCGTFFIMASARRALSIQEPCDPEDLNER